MGESACLLQPFSYTSGFSNESIEGNPIHALGQSISFGRFMSESLEWEKWSTFSNKRYVEEAEKISRPGSVAQKKAFFEAHYKKIAAQKAAALLQLEQANSANAAKPHIEEEANSQIMISNSIDFHEQEQPVENFGVEADIIVKMDEFDAKNVEEDETVDERPDFSTNQSLEMVELSRQPVCFNDFNQTALEKPLLKSFIHEDPATTGKKKTRNSSTKYLQFTKASKTPSSPARKSTPSWHHFATPKQNTKKPVIIDSEDKRRSTLKSLGFSASFTPIKELHNFTSTVMRKIDRSKTGASSTKALKDCSTPLRTPMMPLKGEIRKHPASTSWSEKGSSQFLSTCTNKAKSHFPSTPFSFRTEERAARRKKLEEKFIANDLQNTQQRTKLKEKAEIEMKKLRQALCFKARPLPDFYKERKEQQNEIKKVPGTHLESPKLGRKQNPNRREGAEPTQRPSVKTSADKSNVQRKSHSLRSIMAAHENISPNIQQ